ncbi:uncharacterized protein LOC104894495 isoform X2 [Beta vulgaris subsp. vulgaris]|uniref:uncharacterized protein LOC104894495 isoform X2 n=1 Tax=Beta vulgaris subsp. vulgaris TaxID=3555 RepID=UPI0020373C5B|nr:uncharacterized protein LOC104894495 isoform X2 [Beta vulgaris subsp. vulgaris]
MNKNKWVGYLSFANGLLFSRKQPRFPSHGSVRFDRRNTFLLDYFIISAPLQTQTSQKLEAGSWEGLAPGSRLVYTFFKFKPEEYGQEDPLFRLA